MHDHQQGIGVLQFRTQALTGGGEHLVQCLQGGRGHCAACRGASGGRQQAGLRPQSRLVHRHQSRCLRFIGDHGNRSHCRVCHQNSKHVTRHRQHQVATLYRRQCLSETALRRVQTLQRQNHVHRCGHSSSRQSFASACFAARSRMIVDLTCTSIPSAVISGASVASLWSSTNVVTRPG